MVTGTGYVVNNDKGMELSTTESEKSHYNIHNNVFSNYDRVRKQQLN